MPHPTDIHIGKQLRTIRLAHPLSQEKLAERVGISFQQIYMYEKGSTRIGASRLWQISKALGVPVTSFFAGLTCSGKARENTVVITRRSIQLAVELETIQDEAVKTTLLQLLKACARQVSNAGTSKSKDVPESTSNDLAVTSDLFP